MFRCSQIAIFEAVAILSFLLTGCQAEGNATSAVSPANIQSTATQQTTSHAPITVEARGTAFKWKFLTLGRDKKIATGDETVLGNELVVPANTVVTLVLTSTDYVYTLNVPDGRIAAAVPDMEHRIQFLSPSDGRHEFRTDPMCGLRYFHDEVLGTMQICGNQAVVAENQAR